MKLNVRLILISFVIVLVVSVSSTFIFYSLTGTLISQQQDKSLLNATNDFIFAFQSALEKPEEDFEKLNVESKQIKKIDLHNSSIDFVFTLIKDSLINFEEYTAKKNSFINIQSKSFKQFFKNNPNVILHYKLFPDERTVFFGNLITSNLLDSIANEIRTNVALLINGSPVEISNSIQNQKYLPDIINSVRDLKFKNNFDLYNVQLDNSDFVSSLYFPKQILTPGGKIGFIVFNNFPESTEFRSTLRNVGIIIVIAGSALTFIFVLLFTAKLRKQISLLSEAVEITRKGDMEHRVPVIVKDEVGNLGVAFNSMLDEIKRNHTTEKNYMEFITLINQNPSLQEIADAALAKILKSSGLNFGVLYLVENKMMRAVSSFGVGKNQMQPVYDAGLYANAIEKKEAVEFNFSENYPEIKIGLTSIKIKYLLIQPIVYYKETIAVLELASESVPAENVRTYIDNIQDQLAVGLINSRSLEQLENLVKELKVLNDEYQKQNNQIIEQNEKQKELHKQLREKAEELEKQRAKAVELTKVKSQFLASMSHELRTPLISILGLTELVIKDPELNSKAIERINIVHRNGKKLLGLITNILEFSKFESGKIEVKKESFLLTDFLTDILTGMSQLCREKGLNFDLVKDPDKNILLNTDKQKLEQILNNLLFNAVKFTNKGSIELQIKELRDGDIEFAVSDSGIGISPEHQKNIFAEFQQVEGGTSRKYGGAGLGLAICKKYAELLETELELKSEIGKGSRFSFILRNTILDTFEDNAGEFLSVVEEKPEIINPTILLITDNTDTEKLITDYLTKYNYKVQRESSYSGAFEKSLTNKYDFLIVNLLNKGDLWQFIDDVKSNSKTKNIPVLITTIIEDEKIGWGLNVVNYVYKPLAASSIKKIIPSMELKHKNKISEIFFVGDKKDDIEIVKNSVDDSYSVDSIKDSSALYQRIKTEIPDLIIIDIESIGNDAVDIVRELEQNKITGSIPIIFLMPSGKSKELSKQLTEQLISITKRVGNNAMDVLNFIKNHLENETDPSERAKNIEEKSEDSGAILKTKSTPAPTSKPTILIVDDDSDSLFTIGEFVKELDYDTFFAHNGVECLLTLNHLEPNLILLDIMMPQMDGFETIKRIRADKRFADLPVIALTAYAMLDNKNVIERNGFNDIITKPINSKLLSTKINHYINIQVN